MSQNDTLTRLKCALGIFNLLPQFVLTCILFFALMITGGCIFSLEQYSMYDRLSTILVFVVAVATLKYASCMGGRHAFLKVMGKPAFNYGKKVIFECATQYRMSGIVGVDDFVSDDETFFAMSRMCFIHRPCLGGYKKSKEPERVLFCHTSYRSLEQLKQSFTLGTTCKVSPGRNFGYIMCSLTPSWLSSKKR